METKVYGSQNINKEIITNTNTYNRSNKYQQISTQDILTEMNKYDKNFKIVDFSSANVRKHEKINKQKHLVLLQGNGSEMIDGTNMRIALENSSDGSGSLKLNLAVFRAICLNGLILSDDFMEPVKIRHTKNADWKHSINSLMNAYDETQRRTQAMIERMMNTYMSYGDIGRLTERVTHELLDPSITGSVLDAMQLNSAHRKEDTGKNAWKVYNRIQYNIMQGGIDRIIPKDNEEGILFDTVSKTHIVSDHSKQIKFNKKLHSIIMEAI